MNKLLAVLLVIFLLAIPLTACEDKAQEAWDSGYQQGWDLGYSQGWKDATSKTPSTPQPTGQKLFVGSVNSNIYHYPHCEWAKKISPKNEIWFSSVEEAKAHIPPYRACKVCRPP